MASLRSVTALLLPETVDTASVVGITTAPALPPTAAAAATAGSEAAAKAEAAYGTASAAILTVDGGGIYVCSVRTRT